MLPLGAQPLDLPQIGWVILAGFLVLLGIAWAQRAGSWRIDSFFLGGRNIGAALTEQTYWGSSFSFAGGIVYFAALGWQYGLSAVWFQVPWMVGIWVLIWRLPQLLEITDRFTIHGFLGSLYGKQARLIASIVTITGFIGLFAYEVNITTEILASALRIPGSVFWISMIFCVYVAIHTDVGGYLGLAKTDRFQNICAAMAVMIVVYYLAAFSNNPHLPETLKADKMWDSLKGFSSIPLDVRAGVILFALLINVVDMTHWQTIAANTSKTTTVGSLRWAMFRSSCWMFLFPGAMGTFIGYTWRDVSGVNADNLFTATISGMQGHSGELGGVIVGFIIFGLLGAALSSSAGYLMACVQTLSWDVLNHQKILESRVVGIPAMEQHSMVSRSRVGLYILAILSLLLFTASRSIVHDTYILPMAFVIAAIILSLVPATLLGLWKNARAEIPSKKFKNFMIWSIGAGYIGGISVYFSVIFTGMDVQSVYAWAPITSIICSGAFASWGAAFHFIDGNNKPSVANSVDDPQTTTAGPKAAIVSDDGGI